MPIPNPVQTAQAALDRMTTLLAVTDRQHTYVDLLVAARGVRHELGTARSALEGLGAAVTTNQAGPVRSGAPETSQAAARAIRTRSGGLRHAVLKFLSARGHEGAADFEIIDGLTMVESTARTRRHELWKAGYVQPATVPAQTDGTEPTVVTRTRPKTGLECIVWQITIQGIVALDKLNSGQMVLAFPDPEVPDVGQS